MANSLLIIDSQVSDYDQFLAGLVPGQEYLLLDPDLDGVTQIRDYLVAHPGFDSLRIVSHGIPGVLSLGRTMLDSATLSEYRDALGQIGRSLSEGGDLLLYGCAVAQGEVGQEFISRLAELTGAEVAASTDPTGAVELGGDWELESVTGPIEATRIGTPGYQGLLGLTVSPIPPTGQDHSSGEYANGSAFAALRADGSVVAWGNGYGGDSGIGATESAGGLAVAQVYSTHYAFVALRVDGSVTSLGSDVSLKPELDGSIDVVRVFSNWITFVELREDGSLVASFEGVAYPERRALAAELDGSNDVVQVSSTVFAFAALRADGSVVTWGHEYWGNDSSAVATELDGNNPVVQVFSNNGAFAALRADGSVVTWPGGGWGGDSSAVAAALDGSLDVVQVYSTGFAFAALRVDGSVVSWGLSGGGGDSSGVAAELDGNNEVVRVFSAESAFAALRADGSLVTWGDPGDGGDSSLVAAELDGRNDVVEVFSTFGAFAALHIDGSVTTWGREAGDSSGVASELDGSIDVVEVVSATHAFAALRADGSVVTWGEPGGGGDSSLVSSELSGSIDVIQLVANDGAFAALRADGSVVTWGDSTKGGDTSGMAEKLSDVVSLATPFTDDVYAVDYPSTVACLRLSTDAVSLSEGDSGPTAYTFTVNRSGDTSLATTVGWEVTGNGVRPVDADGADFVGGLLPTGTVSFAVGETNKVISIEIQGDTSYESDERFTLTLNNPTNGVLVIPRANGTIVNDDDRDGGYVPPFFVDLLAPLVTAFTQSSMAIEAPMGSDLVVTFDEVIRPGSGQVVLRTTAGGQVASYDIATSQHLTLSGNTLHVDPGQDLSPGVTYRLELTTGVVLDLTGNPYSGADSFSFTTQQQVTFQEDMARAWLIGGRGHDALTGLADNDLLLGLQGDDAIDGSGGLDIAVYSSTHGGYRISGSLANLTVVDQTGNEGSDQLSQVERLHFADLDIAFDIDGNAGQAYRLYQTALNRAPDLAGLGSWIGEIDRGLSITQAARGFIDSVEFHNLYGANLSNGDFVNLLYGNGLQRLPEQVGYDYWVTQLDSGTQSREQVLVGISESTESKDARLPAVAGGIEFLPYAPASGTEGTDYLFGTDTADHLSSQTGNDTLIGLGGSDLLDGGDGRDTAIYTSFLADYHVTHSGAVLMVLDIKGLLSGTFGGDGGDGGDTLVNIERLHFADHDLAFDIDGNAGQAYRLYQAAFDRAPDLAGLGFWIGEMDKGVSIAQVSRGFIESAEFHDLYGNNPSNGEFVELLYQIGLQRHSDSAGYDYWVGQLDSGDQSREQVLVGFSESHENQLALLGVIEDGIEFIGY